MRSLQVNNGAKRPFLTKEQFSDLPFPFFEQETLDNMIKAILRKLFSSSYLYVALHEYIKTLDNAIEKEKNNEHLKRYKSVYEDVIHESRRSKAEAA